jgi:hypothetical protein
MERRFDAKGIPVCWLLALGWSVAGAQEHAVATWAEFTGSGTSVRAIVSGNECPAASVDGKPLRLIVRQASTADFPVTTCQGVPPAGAKFATVGGEKLALAPRKLKRIVVIGDTGCRLKGAQIQDCNDPRRWPFSTMTKNAAAKKPDLVIHVGDYYYRESPCPEGNAGCNGSPHGDRWDSWRADFFEPASTLLTAAPWIFARGNHEQCGRGADGWFRFLDAGESPLSCPATAAPFMVDIDRLKLEVIDTADVNDQQLSTDRLAFDESQIAAVPRRDGGSNEQATWVITHKPLWGYELTRTGQALVAQNPLLAAAASAMDKPRTAQLPAVQLLLAGHIHLFAALDFANGGATLRPAELIVGDGGTMLDSSDLRGGEQMIDGLLAKYSVKDTFGYFVMEREKKGWTGVLYSVDDSVLARCKLTGRQIDCLPGGKE